MSLWMTLVDCGDTLSRLAKIQPGSEHQSRWLLCRTLELSKLLSNEAMTPVGAIDWQPRSQHRSQHQAAPPQRRNRPHLFHSTVLHLCRSQPSRSMCHDNFLPRMKPLIYMRTPAEPRSGLLKIS